MKILRFNLLPMVLLPLCFGATTLKRAGYMQPHYYEPLSRSASTYDFPMSYTYEHVTSLSRFTVYLTTYHHTGGVSKKLINMVTVDNFALPFTLNFENSIDYDDFPTGQDTFRIEISVYNAGFVGEFYSVALSYSANYYINIDEESGYYDRGSLEGWDEDYSGKGPNQVVRYEWKGFEQDIVDPDYMLFPLNVLKIRMRNQRGEYCSLPFKEATLSIYDIKNFKVGTLINTFLMRKRVVELVATYDSSHYTVFSTKQAVTYSPDFRIVRENGAVTSADKTVHAIFLPPVANGEVRTTTFSIDLIGAGINGKDSFHSYFKVVQSHNYIGSYPVSEYYVEES